MACLPVAHPNQPPAMALSKMDFLEIESLFEKSDKVGKERIIRDLFVMGKEGKAMEERDYLSLSAELFIKSPDETREHFLGSVKEENLLKIFTSALSLNNVYHHLLPEQCPLSRELLALEDHTIDVLKKKK